MREPVNSKVIKTAVSRCVAVCKPPEQPHTGAALNYVSPTLVLHSTASLTIAGTSSGRTPCCMMGC